jgi:Cas7 group CRISPR-associated protein Csh2
MTTNKDNNLVPRITGLLILEVRKSNPNGDPERESSPRQRPDGKGEISPVSVKRKLRDLVLEKEGVVWQHAKAHLGISKDAQFQILEDRDLKRATVKKQLETDFEGFKNTYWDARLFGNTFLEEAGPDTIRAGVAHFGVGVSLAPIEIEFSTWTKKAPAEEGKTRGMAPMAFRVVKHGLYAVPFFVNPNLAHKTGCTKLDVDLMLQLLKHTYANTRSVIRTMVEVVHAHTLTHESRAGSVSDFAFLDALMPRKKEHPDKPSDSLMDYVIPQWKDQVEKQEARKGSGIKFSACGEYKDYAL